MIEKSKLRGDQLLEVVVNQGGDKAANELLAEFFNGYPIEHLRSLFDSTDEQLTRTAAWIISELGVKAAPLIDVFGRLLAHPSRYVRFFTLDAVLVCATELDGQLVAAAIQLLQDADEAVRWKALVFLSKASNDQLASSVSTQSDDRLVNMTKWLINLQLSGNVADEVSSKIDSADELERLFAAAGAYRMFRLIPALLKNASESRHPEIASFAAGQLKLLA